MGTYRHGRLRRVATAGFATLALTATTTTAPWVAAPTAGATTTSTALVEQPLAALTGPGAVPVVSAALDGALRSTAAARIGVVTTGVDLAALPEAVRGRVSALHGSTDPLGYGTFVVSQLLQVAPAAQLTVVSAYPGGRFNSGWLHDDLKYFATNAASFDAVLYAVPPQAYLDPVSDMMARGSWEALDAAMSAYPLEDAHGRVVGVPLNAALRAKMTRGIPATAAALINTWAELTNRWNGVLASLDKLAAGGVPVVAAAGDLGAGTQRVLGVAGLAQVVTVGAGDRNAVLPTSSTGPSWSGGPKPDLVAPTGVVGLMPAASSLAASLKSTGRLDAALVPDLPGEVPAGAGRARLGSSLTAAAVVASAAAGMHAAGVRDAARIRAALAAAAVPLPGVPVTAQGAGLLRFTPDAAFARTAGLVLGAADLGAEPASGTWRVTLPVVNAVAGTPTARLTEFSGVGPDGRSTSAPRNEPYPLAVSAGTDGVTVSAPVGEESYEGGLYCGYTEVPLAGTSGEADATLTAHGVPAGTEQVPTCLVNGSRLRALAFYIHDLPTENQTFAFFPKLPVAGGVLDHALMLLPVNPLAPVFYRRVTAADGYATFPNLPPGHYTMKLHSDYGVPQAMTVHDAVTGQPVEQKRDTGEPLAYQAIDVLALSAVCGNPLTVDAETPDPCTEQFLVDRFGRDAVKPEKPTSTWLVTPVAGGPTLRVAFGALKKMAGTNVGGRIVDLLGLTDFTATSADLSSITKRRETALPETAAWTYRADAADPEAFTADFDPLYLTQPAAAQTGVLRYDFALPTPNYKLGYDLNFRYELRNAALAVVVVVGNEVVAGSIVGGNQVTLPAIGAEAPVDPFALKIDGTAGAAGFHFKLLPRGARSGSLYLVVVPAVTSTSPPSLVPPQVSLRDMSVELNTWVNADWPPATTTHGAGHTFAVNPNYTPAQMQGRPCRQVRSRTTTPGGVVAKVCEDWQILVHSPLHRAATVDVLTAAGASVGNTLRRHGAVFANPHRGTFGGLAVLAFPDVSLDALRTRVSVDNSFRTNGRFWEQFAIPRDVIAANPGPLLVEVLDYAEGAQSPFLRHLDGHTEVSPYVNFVVGG